MRTIYQAVSAIVCAHAQSRKYSTQEKQLNYVNIAENRNETFIKAQNASTEKNAHHTKYWSRSKTYSRCVAMLMFPFLDISELHIHLYEYALTKLQQT